MSGSDILEYIGMVLTKIVVFKGLIWTISNGVDVYWLWLSNIKFLKWDTTSSPC